MRAPLYSANPNELFEPDTIANPQKLYARLRAEAPIARIADSGVHLLATWDLIAEALARESDFSANLTGVLMRSPSGDPTIFEMFAVAGNDASHVIATADEPDHSVHRAIVQPRFAGAFVSALEETVRRWSRESLWEWLAAGAGDFVPVAELVPARVVGDLLGLPEGDASRFRTWAMIGGDILAGHIDGARLGLLAAEALKMMGYLGEHLDRAKEHLRREADAPLMHALAGGIEDGRIDRGAAIGTRRHDVRGRGRVDGSADRLGGPVPRGASRHGSGPPRESRPHSSVRGGGGPSRPALQLPLSDGPAELRARGIRASSR
jgi:cytochrome P450 family 144